MANVVCDAVKAGAPIWMLASSLDEASAELDAPASLAVITITIDYNCPTIV